MTEKLKVTIGEENMADLKDLGYESVSDMSTDEAIELLRQIRLNRRTPVKKAKNSTKSKKNSAPSVNADQAEQLLKMLIGGK